MRIPISAVINENNKMTPAQLSLRDTMYRIEELPAHPLLTDTINLLEQAKMKLEEYADKPRPEVT